MIRLRLLHKIEAGCIAVATGGAASGLHGIRPLGVPLDRAGMYADLGAGSFALAHWLNHRRKSEHAEDHSHDG